MLIKLIRNLFPARTDNSVIAQGRFLRQIRLDFEQYTFTGLHEGKFRMYRMEYAYTIIKEYLICRALSFKVGRNVAFTYATYHTNWIF
jgi:hypothetical protein